MSLKVFGTTDLFLPVTGSVLGRTSVNAAFLRALFQYGSFDQYHFFYAELSEKKAFEAIYRPFLEALNLWQSIRLFPISFLPTAVGKIDYIVFHRGDMELSRLIDYRNTLSNPFPVTGTAHSLSTHHCWDELLHFYLVPAKSYDGLISATSSTQTVLHHLMDSAKSSLQSRGLSDFPTLSTPVIPLSIDEHELQLIDSKIARSECDIPNELPLILMLGRFSQYSKYDLLPVVKSLMQLLDKGYRFYTIIAGDNSETDYASQIQFWILQQGYSDFFKIIPDPDIDLKNNLFSAADIFISPSDTIQETFGLTIIEAYAHGVPVVASLWNGYRDLMIPENKVNFFDTYWMNSVDAITNLAGLMPNRPFQFLMAENTVLNLVQMQERVIYLLNHPKEAHAIGVAEQRTYRERFAWESIISQYENVWSELKSQARSDKNSSANLFFSYHYNQTFSHYPSAHLRLPDEFLHLTGDGRAVVNDETELLIYEELQMDLDEEVIYYSLECLEKQSLFGRDLIALIQKKYQLLDSVVLFNLVWMVKYQLIRVGSS